LNFDVDALIARHERLRATRALAYRPRGDLPFDAAAVPVAASLLLDTTVYIDALAGRLPSPIAGLISSRPILHAAPAVTELALPVGHLDPADPRTAATLAPMLHMLRRIPADDVVAPDPGHWLECALIAGTLARSQGIPKADRRKLLNDVLLYLLAEETGATLVTRNTRDFDLLLQVRPGASVLFYDRT
jgi:predicted nucleic acid-binding protein